MDSATQDIYYQKINELLLDEEKVITCVSLADTLKLNINDAKTLLSTFVKDFRQQKPKDLELTYIVTGSLKDGKGLAVQMVKEEDLNEKKKNFETIYTELIYSIQKNKNIDFNVIALIDKNILEGSHNVGGLIVPDNCGKREIKKKVPQPTQTESVKEKGSFFKKVQSNDSTNGSDTQSGSFSQEKPIKSKQSGSIANFFTKASQKTNGNSQPDKEKIQPKEESLPETIKTENEKIQPKEVLLQETENPKINIKQEPVINGTDETEKQKCVQNMEVDNDKTPVEQPQQKVNSKKRKKNVKSENTSNKKRKRIQEICDSDSSDIFEDEKDEDIIERSDEEPEPVPVIKPLLEADGSTKCKRRKAVDEVYMDDEGFMVTTTKYVYVSEDDEEKQPVKSVEEKPKVLVEKKNSTTDSENDGKKSKASKGKAKNKKAASGTQTTLMNFFKKN